MPRINDLHQLFKHDLEDIYDAESKLVDALRKQAAQSTDPKVRAAFQSHERETVKQKERVEKVFDIFGREPSRGQGCAGIDGLLEEHKNFMRQDAAPQVIDLFNLVSAQKVERYEITAYEGLIRVANRLGLDDAVELLEANLDEEEAALETLMELSDSPTILEKVTVGPQ